MRTAFTALLVGAILLGPAPVAADSELPPYSHATYSHDKKYIFVMLSGLPPEQDGLSLPDQERAEGQRLRRLYPRSGLYLNDGSTTPLWTVGWYAHGVHVAADGVHLVREGPWASSRSDEALTFFAGGRELRAYKVGDLVDSTLLLPHSVSHFLWQGSGTLDDKGQTLTLVTLSWDRYVFDLRTGQIISARRPIRAILVGLGAAAGLVIFRLVRRSRKAQALKH